MPKGEGGFSQKVIIETHTAEYYIVLSLQKKSTLSTGGKFMSREKKQNLFCPQQN